VTVSSTVRLVTLLVLMFSDLDVIFSMLFFNELRKAGERDSINYFFLMALIIGMISYAVAISFFGPRQKFKTMKIVKQLMITNPDQFILGNGARLTEFDRVDPIQRISPAFNELGDTKEGMQLFKAGLTARGLLHMWTAADGRNARNCVEIKHGIPFLRSARFAFFSEPGPKDLGCILNANAAYTLCCGLLQIAFGTMLLVAPHQGSSLMNSLLPLGISTFSLLLSLANVLLDFASMLSQLDEEKRIALNIENEIDAELHAQTKVLESRRDRALAAIDQRFVPDGGGFSLTAVQKVARREEVETVNRGFETELLELNATGMERLSIGLRTFRAKLKKTAEIMKDKAGVMPRSNVGRDVARISEAKESYQDSMERLEQGHVEYVTGLDATQMTPQEFGKKVEDSEGAKNARVAVLQGQHDALVP